MNLDLLKADLRRDEGERLKPYRDTVGKLTIGVGRNLDDVGISLAESDFLLESDVKRVLAELDARLPWWRSMDEPRQRALANMAFNLGTTKLLDFKNTLALLKAGKFAAAGDNALRSRWAKQVGARAARIRNLFAGDDT